MLELKNVSKFYNSNGVTSSGLHNVTLKFSKNEIVAITGESGSGKSTLLNVLTKMDTFDEGEIYYKGNETSYFGIDDMDNFRKDKIGFIFQNYNIIDSYTVLENVMLPLVLKGINQVEAKAKALELIERVGLKSFEKNRGSKLSGGQKQRCVIARALASDCEILACDEPTGNLDSKTGEEIIKLIKEVASDKLVLIVTHNFEQVKDIVTRKIVVSDGEITEDKIFNELPDDENQELNLDAEVLPKKIDVKIASNNLLFTPKKTIFSTLVLLFVAIFAFSLYQVCYYTNSNLDYYNDFNYSGKGKVVGFHSNGKMFDKDDIEKISSKYEINLFSENYYLNYSIQDNTSFYYMSFSYEENIHDLSLDGGRMPENDNEAIVVCPTYVNDTYLQQNILNKELLNRNSSKNIANPVNTKIKIVGYQIRSDIHNWTFTKCEIAKKLIKIQPFMTTSASCTFKDALGDESTWMLNLERNQFTTGEGYISLPRTYSTDFKLESRDRKFVGNYYFDFYSKIKDYKIVIEEVYNEPTLVLSSNDDLFDDTPFEVTFYGDNEEIIKKLEDLGYDYVDVSKYTESSKLEQFLANLSSYLLMTVSTIAIVIIYFISYIILSKIYASKKKDYTILRTLGVTKKDMSHIVTYEVMLQTIVTSVLVYVVLFILGKTIDNNVFKIFKEVTLVSSLIYFIVILVFGYLTAKRFNQRLFKFSVNQTFKGEVAKND